MFKILLLANSIVMTLSVSLGFGLHLLEIAFSNREKLLLLGSLSTTFSTLSAVLSKTSFGLTLLRLTQVGYDKTRAFVWVIMVSMNLLMFCDALYSWVECQPSRKHWEIFTDGTCWSPDIAVQFGIAAGAYSGCMDIIMAILPWRIIWETRMERKEKFGVLVAMSMGLCAGAAAFAKCSQIPQISFFDETCMSCGICFSIILRIIVLRLCRHRNQPGHLGCCRASCHNCGSIYSGTAGATNGFQTFYTAPPI